jgi:hypothetical protein
MTDRPLFLRQRLSSDYCAVYAAAMWVSIIDRPVSRAQSHAAFGTRRPGWHPPDEPTVAKVLSGLLNGRDVRLDARRYPNSSAMVGACKGRLARSTALLVAATCRLRSERVTAKHAFVVTGSQGAALQVLDSLGSHPGSQFSNALIPASSKKGRRFAEVIGARWDIDLVHPIVFFGTSHEA